VAGVYEKAVDRESAYEKLKGRAATTADTRDQMQQQAPQGAAAWPTRRARSSGAAHRTAGPAGGRQQRQRGLLGGLGDILFGSTGPRGGRREGLAEAAAKSAIRTIGSSVGREIVRGVLGSLLGGSSKRR
jgi:hypothetical protein